MWKYKIKKGSIKKNFWEFKNNKKEFIGIILQSLILFFDFLINSIIDWKLIKESNQERWGWQFYSWIITFWNRFSTFSIQVSFFILIFFIFNLKKKINYFFQITLTIYISVVSLIYFGFKMYEIIVWDTEHILNLINSLFIHLISPLYFIYYFFSNNKVYFQKNKHKNIINSTKIYFIFFGKIIIYPIIYFIYSQLFIYLKLKLGEESIFNITNKTAEFNSKIYLYKFFLNNEQKFFIFFLTLVLISILFIIYDYLFNLIKLKKEKN
jgi:hypothetical protein